MVARWTLVLAVIAGVSVARAEPREWRGYEVPAYAVERRDGPVEIRRVAPHTVAEVTLSGSRGSTLRQGFRSLAGYIFGGNEAGAKVAMTAPVTQGPGDQRAGRAPHAPSGGEPVWTVRFAMPSSESGATLPRPENAAIRIFEVPAERIAARRFSGWGSFGRWGEEEARLRRWLQAEGIDPAGPARHLYYDDPFTVPWRRRNEVVLPLE